MVVVAPDGVELARGGVGGADQIVSMLDTANKKFETPVVWADTLKSAKERAAAEGKLVLALFVDDKAHSKKTEEALAARTLTIPRKRLICVKIVFDTESEDVKTLGASQAPHLFLINPKGEESKQVVLGSLGAKTESALRSWLEDGFRRYDESQRDKGSLFKKKP